MSEHGFRGIFVAPVIDEDVMETLPLGPTSEMTEWLDKVRLDPRQSEAGVLAQIEATAEVVVTDLFADADRAMEFLRLQARVVQMVDRTEAISTPGHDPKTGELQWVTDERGEFVLDWRKVDGMDIEAAIMALQAVIERAQDDVSKLHARAAMAYQVKEDEYWDAYRRTMGGTVNDATAAAHRGTRDARYYFFAMWVLWMRADRKLEAVKATKRDLEFMRQRLVKEADRPWPSQR